jgi:hypothetical protein
MVTVLDDIMTACSLLNYKMGRFGMSTTGKFILLIGLLIVLLFSSFSIPIDDQGMRYPAGYEP